MPKFLPALGSAAAIVVVAALALSSYVNRQGGTGALPSPRPTTPLGIFQPFAGRIVYYSGGSLSAVDPSAPADPATRVELSHAGTPLGWSSDGTRLLIMRPTGLLVLQADGSATQLTTDPMSIRGATISPDGSRVVFAGGTGTLPEGGCCTSWALYAVDADGGPVEMLREARKGIVEDPTFSPDGTRIAYDDGNHDHGHSVWLMDADGSGAHEIVSNESTTGAGHMYGLAWSPAGDRIALGVEGTTYTFATDGSGFTRVITHGDLPYWSPDGSQLAYTVSCAEDLNGCGLAIADADGSNVRTFGVGVSGPWHPGTLENDAGE